MQGKSLLKPRDSTTRAAPGRGAALLAALALLAACASAGDSRGYAERELAHREDQVRRGLAGARDPGAERDLHALACRLLPERCAQVRVYVVDSDTVQARAWPNGMLLVHGALFDHLDDEAELAFALGHELAHLALGHFQAGRSAALETAADAWASGRLVALGYRRNAGITLLTRLATTPYLGTGIAQARIEALARQRQAIGE